MNNWMGSKRYQPLEIGQSLLVVLVDYGDFLVIENKTAEARKQDRVGIHLMNVETC